MFIDLSTISPAAFSRWLLFLPLFNYAVSYPGHVILQRWQYDHIKSIEN